MKTFRIVPHQGQEPEKEGYLLFDLMVEGEEAPKLSGVFYISVEEFLIRHAANDDVIVHPNPEDTMTGAELREAIRVVLKEIEQYLAEQAEWERSQPPLWFRRLRDGIFKMTWSILWHLKEWRRA